MFAGRDIEEAEKAIQFSKDTCRWTITGEAAEVRRSDERSVILKLIADNREPMTPSEGADALGWLSERIALRLSAER